MRELADYRKPKALLALDLEAAAKPRRPAEIQEAIRAKHRSLGLELRRAGLKDLEALRSFRLDHRPPPIGRQITRYDLYRILRYGSSPILVDEKGRIRGMLLEVRYYRECQISCGISMAVDKAIAGHGLAADLLVYAGCEAAAAGCRLQRGIVSPENQPALSTLLNKVGYLAEDFLPSYPGLGGSRLTLCWSLEPRSLLGNRVDATRLAAFLESGRRGHDFRLIALSDTEGLSRLYHEGGFKVIAFAPAGSISDTPWLVAVADRLLRLVELYPVSPGA